MELVERASPNATRPRPRPRAADRRPRRAGARAAAGRARSIRTRASRASASTTRRPRRSPTRFARRASSSRSSCGRAPAGGLRADRRRARWRAAREAGLPTVPALVREADDRDTLLLGLVENVAREELSPVEEARAYALLLDEFELSLGDLAERVGNARSRPSRTGCGCSSSRTTCSDCVERGELTEGHARAVLAVPDHDGRRRLARADRPARVVGACGRARRTLGRGAKTKPRKVPKVDPVLAERVRKAAERLTGFPARIVSGRLRDRLRRQRPSWPSSAEALESDSAGAVPNGGRGSLTRWHARTASVTTSSPSRRSTRTTLTRDLVAAHVGALAGRQAGPVPVRLARDAELDDVTEGHRWPRSPATRSFLLAVEDYLVRTEIVHLSGALTDQRRKPS
mgnify:CR=1 FL=1